MTSSGVPDSPPWPVDVLADLHGRALPDPEAQRLWPRVAADPDALAVLAALTETRTALSSLSPSHEVAPVATPEVVATRLNRALRAEAAARANTPDVSPPGRVTRLSAKCLSARAERGHGRLLGWAMGSLAAAAAVALVALIIVRPANRVTSGHALAEPAPGVPASAPLALGSGKLSHATLRAAMTRYEPGAFSNRRKLSGCLRANEVRSNAQLVTMTKVTRKGAPGMMFVLTTGKLATFRLLVVGDECSSGVPATMDDVVVGPK